MKHIDQCRINASDKYIVSHRSIDILSANFLVSGNHFPALNFIHQDQIAHHQ
jgi:hypothetical protein